MGTTLSLLLATSAALYTLAGISHLFLIARRAFDLLARWSTRAAWLVHTTGLVALLWEAQRAPVHTVFEFSFFFAWMLMTGYVIMEGVRRNQSAGSFLVPVIAVLQVIGVGLPKPSGELILAQYPASLVGWHIGVTMLGYGFFFGSFIAGALYLLQERNLRRKTYSNIYYGLPSLETLDIWSGRFVAVGFPLLTLGMSAGLYFAHVTFSNFWESDPKVIFTVFVWLVYGGYLVTRKMAGWGGRRTAWWSVVGVAGLLVNYFIVNLISRMHRFGV